MKRIDTVGPTIVADTREQIVWPTTIMRNGKPVELPVVRAKLEVGDYACLGLESGLVIERKSINDLVGTLFGEHEGADGVMLSSWDRFCRELERGRSVARMMVIVEATRADVYAHRYRSRVNPKSVIGRADSIFVDWGVPVIFAGDRVEAARLGIWSLSRWWWLRQRDAQKEVAA